MKTVKILSVFLIIGVAFALTNCANQNKKASLRRIHFDFDKSYIRSDMVPIMDDNAVYLKKGKRHFSTKNRIGGGRGSMVTIEGHCDNRGTNEYNYALGTRRSESAKSYLVTHGIDASRVKTVTYGEDRPLCAQNDEPCWYKNRRAEFKLH